MKTKNQLTKEALHTVATMMSTTINTAPKARGVDVLDYLILEKEEMAPIIEEMKKQAEAYDLPFFVRDALCLEQAQLLLLIGASCEPRSLPNCAVCGFANCHENRQAGARCAYGHIDLGIAVGSAVGLASQLGLDTRIMFTVGKAAHPCGYLLDSDTVLGIPLSSTGKSPFFDRKRI